MKTELYTRSLERLPREGKHIIGYQEGDDIIVYQAYKPVIADFAVRNQMLGGSGFSYERMSWIKPGFLWMMFRSAWAGKVDQERILAISIAQNDFKQILAEAVPTTFKRKQYNTEAEWKADLKAKDVRLQWDPDHDPFGRKQERRAIQLGLSDAMLDAFGKRFVKKIEDITGFVHEQKAILDREGIAALLVPFETVINIEEPVLLQAAGL